MDTNSAKTFSWKKAILLSLSAGLLAVSFSVFFQARSQTVQVLPAENPKSVAAVPASAGFGSSFEMPADPVRLIIPSIGVNAAIQDVGMSWSGVNMGVPTNFTDVGWYKYGPVPGTPGNAVIDGHLDGKYVPKAVFYNLGNLKPGDLVEVVDQTGKTWQFQVIRLAAYDYNASTSDIFSGDASAARLDLITCAGDWIPSQKLYNQRVVVFTELEQSGS